MRVERIGNATLYLGDCREIVPTLPRPAALITDPPYGQKQKVNTFYAGGTRSKPIVQRGGSVCVLNPVEWPSIHGDDEDFDPAPWLTSADIVLLWGAHKFHHRLPKGGGWLIWDKVPTGKVRDQGDGEAAWINRDQPMRIYRLLWDGLSVGLGARHECTAGQQRVHPTQKPEILMRWCIQQARVPAGGVVRDPYMGAGGTAVACAQLGYPFEGMEIEERYFDTACERADNAQRQGRMFA